MISDASYTYVADEAYFPYGKLGKTVLNERVSKIVRHVDSSDKVDCVVIACNTASTVVLEYLRFELKMPIVGTVPAIKVAAALSKTKVIGVLATVATAKGVYIQTLIRQFARDCEVRLVGAENLAKLAEDKLNGIKIDTKLVENEITKLFAGDGIVDQIVLGCTHYPFLLTELKSAAKYPVNWVDPSVAVGMQVKAVLKQHPNFDAAMTEHYYTTGLNTAYQNLADITFKQLIIV